VGLHGGRFPSIRNARTAGQRILNVVDLILSVFKSLRLENFKARLSFRDPALDKAQMKLRESPRCDSRAVETLGMEHFEGIGEAAFYGPKLDFIRDAQREWQLA